MGPFKQQAIITSLPLINRIEYGSWLKKSAGCLVVLFADANATLADMIRVARGVVDNIILLGQATEFQEKDLIFSNSPIIWSSSGQQGEVRIMIKVSDS